MFSSDEAITAFDVAPVPVARDRSKLAVAILPIPVAVIAFDNTLAVTDPVGEVEDEVTVLPVISASISAVPS